MTGKVVDLTNFLNTDDLGCAIANKWLEWDILARQWKLSKEEIQRYIFATDTSTTTNSTLPWKNKTTLPKLCQIRDNLYANYTASLFPKRKWLIWEANNKESDQVNKRDAITNYMAWVISQASFKHEIDKIILDYIDYGNCFATVEWSDDRVQTEEKVQVGYVGPQLRRINPNDIRFNPTVDNFLKTPKIVRSFVSLGEVKKMLNNFSNSETKEAYDDLWKYLQEVRNGIRTFPGEVQERDNMFSVDGFHSFRAYLESDNCEILTFYGDMYDSATGEFLENHIIMVVDRHKVIYKKPNPSSFGYPPIFHIAWRKRQDNLWGMGPLDNLVGMQYRMDHLENLKADVFDQIVAPMLHIQGMVEDFNWEPFGRIYSDVDGKVNVLSPDVNALQANIEIQSYERQMEEMAGAPKEALGFRTPGEKTAFEVQRLENAASRVFQNKIKQFEEQLVEPLLNAMLELARRNLVGVNSIKVFDDEFKFASFQDLTVQDITGTGRIKPVAARHFAEQAEIVQNLNNLSMSGMFPLVQPHMSGIQLAYLFEDIMGLDDYEIVTPYISIAEQADAQRQAQALQEQVMMESMTPSGLSQDDASEPFQRNPLEELSALSDQTEAPTEGPGFTG